jgi:ATP-binding cassette subfamily B protein
MKKRFNLNFLELILDQTKDFYLYYFFGIIFLFLTHKIQSDLPFMAKNLADMIGKADGQIDYHLFLWYAVGIVIFRTSSRILFFYPARVLQRWLRDELLDSITSASPLRYKHYNSGQLFQYLTNDIDQIRALIGFVGLQGGNFIIGILVLVPKLINFNSQLLWALIPMVISFILFTVIVSRNREYFKKSAEAAGEIQNSIIESYIGKKTIKNFHAEAPFIELFSKLSLKEMYYFYRSSIGLSITLPMIALGVGLSLLWGAHIIKVNHLGASTLIVFSGFIFLFMEPLSYLSWIGVVVSRSSTSWKRLMDLNHLLSTRSDLEIQLEKSNLKIEDNKITLPFWDTSILFDFKPKALNVLVARTGHGKTHLLLMIAEVLLLKQQKVSVVFQSPYIYNDSIRNNIFLGASPNDQQIFNAKKLLNLFGMNVLESNLDKLLDLEVGENGKRLSGGQQKRLCLIRSIMSDADYILWDDPFSSVDLILEKEIITELKLSELIKNRTIILTSHRLSTVKNSDFVIYLDKNSGVIEEGPVSLVLQSSGKLNEYFQQQMV